MTVHLLLGHMLDKLLYLNADLKKCSIRRILLTLHRVTITCFQIKLKNFRAEIFLTADKLN